MHIGNGVSHCAIKNGVSVDTSMGLTPLEGAMMGTRCGDIDPAIPAFMMQKDNLSAKEIDSILNKKSGVIGITGRFTDRRDVIEHAENGRQAVPAGPRHRGVPSEEVHRHLHGRDWQAGRGGLHRRRRRDGLADQGDAHRGAGAPGDHPGQGA